MRVTSKKEDVVYEGIRILDDLKRAPFSLEDEYPEDADMIRVSLSSISDHAPFVCMAVSRLMDLRFPINSYMMKLLRLRKRPTSVSEMNKLWHVYYVPKLRTIVYRIPFFQSTLLRYRIRYGSYFHRESILGWSGSPTGKGFIKGTNYWTDGQCVVHENIIRRFFDLPEVEVEPYPRYLKLLRIGENYSLVREIYLVDNPLIYAPAPFLEITTSQEEVFFYDSRYADVLYSRWLFPGCLINRVNEVPFAVWKRGRVIPVTAGQLTLVLRPLQFTEMELRLWRAMWKDRTDIDASSE